MLLNDCDLRLTLRELRRSARFLETVLLSLLHTRIASKEARFFERSAVHGICFYERAGYAVANSSRLSRKAAALDVYIHVELVRSSDFLGRLTDDILERIESEIVVDAALVDNDIAVAGKETNAGYCLLTSARAPEL